MYIIFVQEGVKNALQCAFKLWNALATAEIWD